ncbi:Hypothetical protein R9X50_00005700 [Acrodontium crateriforme]|uniref:Uncharacterized protein n=1 Tax=Acrodontium crateriforme TaxID=150365 RepID=A0AAQ3R4M3_9PEZI|nr:Hypothetical protein R9X50_00005700 [Acrodontium crateriforme]
MSSRQTATLSMDGREIIDLVGDDENNLVRPSQSHSGASDQQRAATKASTNERSPTRGRILASNKSNSFLQNAASTAGNPIQPTSANSTIPFQNGALPSAKQGLGKNPVSASQREMGRTSDNIPPSSGFVRPRGLKEHHERPKSFTGGRSSMAASQGSLKRARQQDLATAEELSPKSKKQKSSSAPISLETRLKERTSILGAFSGRQSGSWKSSKDQPIDLTGDETRVVEESDDEHVARPVVSRMEPLSSSNSQPSSSKKVVESKSRFLDSMHSLAQKFLGSHDTSYQKTATEQPEVQGQADSLRGRPSQNLDPRKKHNVNLQDESDRENSAVRKRKRTPPASPDHTGASNNELEDTFEISKQKQTPSAVETRLNGEKHIDTARSFDTQEYDSHSRIEVEASAKSDDDPGYVSYESAHRTEEKEPIQATSSAAATNNQEANSTEKSLTDAISSVVSSSFEIFSNRSRSSGPEANGIRKLLRPVVMASEMDTTALEAQATTEASNDSSFLDDGIDTQRVAPSAQMIHEKVMIDAAFEMSNLTLSNRVESLVSKYLDEMSGDNEHYTRAMLKRARLCTEMPTLEQMRTCAPGEKPYDFAGFKPLKAANSKTATGKDEVKFIIAKPSSGGGRSAVKWSRVYYVAPLNTFKSEDTMPAYSHYVTVKHNFLARNERTMYHWPYFGDDFDFNEAQSLRETYAVDIDRRQRKLVQLLQAQRYEEYVESTLSDLSISWTDILRFLLEPKPDVGSDPDAIRALKIRDNFCREDFVRKSRRSYFVLSSLPPSTPANLSKAAVLCEGFQKLTKLSLWHVARRHLFDSVPAEPIEDAEDMAELTCKLCLRWICPHHGEIWERAVEEPSSDQSDSPDNENAIATDIINPPKIDRRIRVAFPANEASAEPAEAEPKRDRRHPKHWNGFVHNAEEREPFYPCHHPGVACEDAVCTCFMLKIPCEKTCDCSKNCSRKWQGCACRRKGRKLCYDDETCACYQLGRECDPDLCGPCGACTVLDPVNLDNPPAGTCRNVSLQRGVAKHTIMGDSVIHGLGLYAGEDIASHEFIGEYKGEIITKNEADRRGAVYNYQKLSYLFSLNASQEIDSTYFGNKIRFINHAGHGQENLYPRIQMVNTEHRIGLYACRAISTGEELFFDYGPEFPDEQLGGNGTKASNNRKAKKSTPHVRNANLVRDEFYSIEQEKDEYGNLRARKVERGGRGKRGSARSGGGRRPRSRTAIQEDDEDEQEEDEEEAVKPAPAKNVGRASSIAPIAVNIPNSSDRVHATSEAEAEDDEDEEDVFEPQDEDSVDDSAASEASADESIDDSNDSNEDMPTRRRLHRRTTQGGRKT